MERNKLTKQNRNWALLIGAGMALSPIHNQWLTNAVTQNGEVGFFLPAFGTAIWLMGALAFVAFNWGKLDWGDKRIYIPLLVIVGAIGLSGIKADGIQDKIAPLLMGISLFALYLVARKLGSDLLFPLAIGAGIASVGVIVYGVLHPTQASGGYLFGTNYDIVAGYILLGASLCITKYWQVLAGLALVAMFLSGSPEGDFVLILVALAIIVARAWSKKLLLVIAPAAIVACVWFGLGYGQILHGYTFELLSKVVRVTTTQGAINTLPITPVEVTQPEGKLPSIPLTPAPSKWDGIDDRWRLMKEGYQNFTVLGEGYNLTAFQKTGMVHNVPLVIVQQLGLMGIVAALAWLWITLWCFVKTRWKYSWFLLIALCIFDHFIWTQMAPYWWAMVGVSSSVALKTDLFYRGEN